MGQKVVENTKIDKFKCDILGDFQTLCVRGNILKEEEEQNSKGLLHKSNLC